AYGFEYLPVTERLGAEVYSCYCEKTSGLYLWAGFEKGGVYYSMCSMGLEREEAAEILDGFISGDVSPKDFSADNAYLMRQDLSFEEGASLPEFKGMICKREQLGNFRLQNASFTYMRYFDADAGTGLRETSWYIRYEDIYGSTDGVSVSYVTSYDDSQWDRQEGKFFDISKLTDEKITELCGNDKINIRIYAEGVFVDISGETSEEFLRGLAEHLRGEHEE
ncbi:MAG: hypothetical protein NC078_04935, partial [Ruminococcus sp.]|nr:hypothetical protein [Ruminococcus sp.]